MGWEDRPASTTHGDATSYDDVDRRNRIGSTDNPRLLIKLQCPEATKVAGYNTWRNEFNRHVQEGEQAIWI